MNVGLGLKKVLTSESTEKKLLGVCKMVHGASLAGAQMVPGLATPLYLTMTAATLASAAIPHVF